LVPRAIALKCCALPIEMFNNMLVVAVAEPQDFKILEELRFCSRKAVSPRFSFRKDILDGIRKFYDHEDITPKELVIKDSSLLPKGDLLSADPEEEDTLTDPEIVVANARDENKEVLKELRAGAKKRSFVVRLISLILVRAAQVEANDILIEPEVA
jgi:type II secretory ATPase GspE/PulE/Tfp pilus assembly ATPase PilB-like protein